MQRISKFNPGHVYLYMQSLSFWSSQHVLFKQKSSASARWCRNQTLLPPIAIHTFLIHFCMSPWAMSHKIILEATWSIIKVTSFPARPFFVERGKNCKEQAQKSMVGGKASKYNACISSDKFPHPPMFHNVSGELHAPWLAYHPWECHIWASNNGLYYDINVLHCFCSALTSY